MGTYCFPATGAMRVLLNNGVKNSRVLVPQEGYDFKDEDYFNITTAERHLWLR